MKKTDSPVIEIRNSFCKLRNFPIETKLCIKEILTYKEDFGAEKARIFSLIKYYKRTGQNQKKGFQIQKLKELEAKEIVCWLKGDYFPTGHLRLIKRFLKEEKFSYNIEDLREKPLKKIKLRIKNELLPPRYYQEEMIQKGLKYKRGVFESAVGSGKTNVLVHLINEIRVPSLVVVPSSSLKYQILNDLIYLFGRNKVQEINTQTLGTKKLSDIRVVTIQTLASLKKKGLVNYAVQGIGAIFIDEFHHAGSSSYTNLLEDLDHIYFRFGFTGTYLRNDSKTLDMWGFLSNKLYSYPAYKAVEDGFLVPVDVQFHKLSGKPVAGKGTKAFKKEYDLNYCKNWTLLDKIREIVNESNQYEQILILVNRTDEGGKLISDFLSSCDISNTYIDGSSDKKFVTESINKFNKKSIRILIGSSVIGEGINIKSTDRLIMAQGGKSEIAIVQATGRAIRLNEGKEKAIVHDFLFESTNFLEKHAKARLSIYKNNFQPENIIFD